jgi:hypothetical protein
MTIPISIPAPPSCTGAGIILMRSDGGTTRFFLLCGRTSGIWSFAKGHPEYCDDADLLRTAIRETYEETGLHAGHDYRFVGDSQRFGKRPYWIGRVSPPAVRRMRLSKAEHTMGGWFTIAEISRLRTNVDVRAWAKKASNPNSNFAARLQAEGITYSAAATHSCDAACTES